MRFVSPVLVGVLILAVGAAEGEAAPPSAAARLDLSPRTIYDWGRSVRTPRAVLHRTQAPRALALRTRVPNRVLFEAADAPAPADAKGDGGADLAKTSQNPVGDLISVPFQNNTNFGVGPFDRTQNILNIQPVVPIPISPRWNLITRTIIPILNQPHVEANDGTTFGVGDINPTLFLTPKKPGKIIWGVGPTFFLPTATDSRLGTGKWSAGPSVVLLAMPGKFVLGVLASNFWSFAGSSGRPDVNTFFSQLFVNYNLPRGWFLTTSPIITANWKAASGEQWTVPVGGGVGRVTTLGKQPVSITVQAYYNAIKPMGAAEWQLRLQFTLLFPKK